MKQEFEKRQKKTCRLDIYCDSLASIIESVRGLQEQYPEVTFEDTSGDSLQRAI